MSEGPIGNAEDMFGKALIPGKEPELDKAKFYVLEEAYWFVANGDEPGLFFGKVNFDLIASSEGVKFVRDSNFGAFYLARHQIARSIMSGQLDMYGRVKVEANESTCSDRVYHITPELIDDLDVFDEEEPNLIQGVEFDEMFVPAEQLERRFRFGPSISQLLAEKKSCGHESQIGVAHEWPKIGRPRKWDWDRILVEVALLANTPDGLPEKQADLEQWVCTRCRELFGDEPSVSQVRKRVAPIYQAQRSKGS